MAFCLLAKYEDEDRGGLIACLDVAVGLKDASEGFVLSSFVELWAGASAVRDDG
jgi:hypothetical protein